MEDKETNFGSVSRDHGSSGVSKVRSCSGFGRWIATECQILTLASIIEVASDAVPAAGLDLAQPNAKSQRAPSAYIVGSSALRLQHQTKKIEASEQAELFRLI